MVLSDDFNILEVCNLETFYGACPDHHVMVMNSALYGLMNIGRCLRMDYGNLGCANNVRDYLDTKCSGLRRCNLRIPDFKLAELNKNCPTQFTPYLEVSYECIEVLPGSFHHRSCQSEGTVTIADQSAGVIASSEAIVGPSGVPLCDWIIQAEAGQRINITLLDFTREHKHGHCDTYVIISDSDTGDVATICGGKQRHRHVYTSKSNIIHIQFTDLRQSSFQANFLLRYTVIGCVDPVLNGHILVERSGDAASLRCEHTGLISQLTCVGDRWSGHVANCTANTGFSWWDTVWKRCATSKGVWLTFGVGVSFGTLFGLLLLACILVYTKKYLLKAQQRRDALQCHSPDHPQQDVLIRSKSSDLSELEYNTWQMQMTPIRTSKVYINPRRSIDAAHFLSETHDRAYEPRDYHTMPSQHTHCAVANVGRNQEYTIPIKECDVCPMCPDAPGANVMLATRTPSLERSLTT